MFTYTEMKKQIEKIQKENAKLEKMATKYIRWQPGAFSSNDARLATDKMKEINAACDGLKMVLI